MPDRDAHVRLMVGDLVLKVAELQAQVDTLQAQQAVLQEALTNAPLRQSLLARAGLSVVDALPEDV